MNPENRQSDVSLSRESRPERFCNLDRLLYGLEARGLDGLVATTQANVFYLSGFNSIAHKSDEPRPYAIIVSRHAPEHPIAVVADYYLATFLTQATWIEDLRPFRAVMMGLDLAPKPSDIDRFIPESGSNIERIERARQAYSYDMRGALRDALTELGLEDGRVAFDDMGFGHRLGLDQVEVMDGYDPAMFARAVKTQPEIELIERATRLNEIAIQRTVVSWEKGITWRQLNRNYHQAVTELGGYVRDPGGMVWGHPRGVNPTIMLQSGREDFEVESGTHVMFDCHGTLDLYCWDGGKTWVVDGEPEGDAKRYLKATGEAAETLLSAMRPGVRVSELQIRAQDVYRKAGVPNPDEALIFFHGLGLSHMDLEQRTAEGKSVTDWALEEGMVVPLHLLYPGGDRERSWLEEVVVVMGDGGRPLFSWGFEPLLGS